MRDKKKDNEIETIFPYAKPSTEVLNFVPVISIFNRYYELRNQNIPFEEKVGRIAAHVLYAAAVITLTMLAYCRVPAQPNQSQKMQTPSNDTYNKELGNLSMDRFFPIFGDDLEARICSPYQKSE